MRPGIHLSNAIGITPADEDCARRWAPLSALLAMNNVVEDNKECDKLVRLWELSGRPLLVLRKYFNPEWGTKPNMWAVHASETVIMARRCIARGVPARKIALKPFNEPNMPTWAINKPYGEGFGDKPAHIERYNLALKAFIQVAKNELPEVLIGGPHLTIGNHDVRFPNDPVGDRYYYGPDSLCQEALDMLDLHFVHCYGFRRGQYADRAHGLRFLEYEKYFSKNIQGRPIYIVEGCYGIKWENGNAIDPKHNNVRGEDTVAYLRLLDQYPQVQGITLWIAGDRGWQEHRHSDGWDASTHRPVVGYVEDYAGGEPPPPPVKQCGESCTPEDDIAAGLECIDEIVRNPNCPDEPDCACSQPPPEGIPELELLTHDGRELRGPMAHEYVRQEYGSEVKRYPGSVFPAPAEGDMIMRIVRIEEVEGPNIVVCETKMGTPVKFGFRWDDGPEHFVDEWYPRGVSREGAKVDFIYGSQSIAFPPNGGGHALWVLDQPSDLADRWGWKPLTNHRALYVTFDAIPHKEDDLPDEVDYPGAVWKGPAAQGNFETGRHGEAIRFVVLHGTAKGENVPCDADLATYAVNWFKDPVSEVSAHYVIPRSGGVWQAVRESDTAYHSGSASHNYGSIGIEGEHCGCVGHPWTTETIDSLITMLKHLVAKYSIVQDNILLHRDIVSTDCPVELPFDHIMEEVFGPVDEPSVDEILTLVYGPIWTDQWAGMVIAREQSQFFPIFFADQFQGTGNVGTTRVDWQLMPDMLIYWLNENWQDTRILRWPPDLG